MNIAYTSLDKPVKISQSGQPKQSTIHIRKDAPFGIFFKKSIVRW